MRHSESLWKLLRCTVASAVLLPTTGSAQFRLKDTEWPSYAADLAGSRYRPLDQINASNFNDLEIAWRIKTDNFGDRPEYKLEGQRRFVCDRRITSRGDCVGSGYWRIALDPRRARRKARRRCSPATFRPRSCLLVGRKGRADSLCNVRISTDLFGCEGRRSNSFLWK